MQSDGEFLVAQPRTFGSQTAFALLHGPRAQPQVDQGHKIRLLRQRRLEAVAGSSSLAVVRGRPVSIQRPWRQAVANRQPLLADAWPSGVQAEHAARRDSEDVVRG